LHAQDFQGARLQLYNCGEAIDDCGDTLGRGACTAGSTCAEVRVRVVTGQNTRGDEQWLVIEKAGREGPVEHYVLTTLPKSMSRKRRVRRVKQRWRTERVYEDLKGELGLDHFEGRSYIGFQHHVSCVLACYAFLVAERARIFPPQARRPRRDHSVARAA
jgi:SRSO17 transposase